MAKKTKNSHAIAAVNELVSSFGKTVTHFFNPRYTVLSDGKKQQTNPFAGMKPEDEKVILEEALAMLVGQSIAVDAMAKNPPNFKESSEKFFGICLAYVDKYQQQFLQLKKDTLNEQPEKNPSKGP